MLSREEIKKKSAEEINELIAAEFNIDHFRWQQENKIVIDEPFRAANLNRALYKCPHCLEEGKMLGKDTSISCTACGRSYELDEYGYLRGDSDAKFDHIPDWFAWERECVRQEIEDGKYSFSSPVRICMGVDLKHIYYVGKGTLTHNSEGFHLTGVGGKLDYVQKPQASHSICADFNWYEIGDVICLGNSKALYYCFPDDTSIPVVKTRLAAEEMYKIYRKETR
jgi:hypothetical protein